MRKDHTTTPALVRKFKQQANQPHSFSLMQSQQLDALHLDLQARGCLSDQIKGYRHNLAMASFLLTNPCELPRAIRITLSEQLQKDGSYRYILGLSVNGKTERETVLKENVIAYDAAARGFPTPVLFAIQQAVLSEDAKAMEELRTRPVPEQASAKLYTLSDFRPKP